MTELEKQLTKALCNVVTTMKDDNGISEEYSDGCYQYVKGIYNDTFKHIDENIGDLIDTPDELIYRIESYDPEKVIKINATRKDKIVINNEVFDNRLIVTTNSHNNIVSIFDIVNGVSLYNSVILSNIYDGISDVIRSILRADIDYDSKLKSLNKVNDFIYEVYTGKSNAISANDIMTNISLDISDSDKDKIKAIYERI